MPVMRIYASRVVDDFKLISRTLRRRRLSPRILGEPVVEERRGRKIKTERYGWGKIQFISGALERTQIIIGEEDMSTKMPKDAMPDCIGMFVPSDHKDAAECHGDSEAKAGSIDAKACSWLSQCEIVVTVANKMDATPESLMAAHKLEDIISGSVLKAHELELEAEAEKAAEADGAAPAKKESKADKAKAKAAAKAKKAAPAKKAPAKPKTTEPGADKYADVRPVAESFYKALAKSLGFVIADSKEAAAVGEMYLRDRTDTSFYMTLFVKTAKGWDFSLAVIRLAPKNRVISVLLPVDEAVVRKDCSKALGDLNFDSCIDGKFKSIMRRVAEDKVDDAVLLIKSAVDSGCIELPEAASLSD